MTATGLWRNLKEPITRKIVFLVVIFFGALGLLLAQHHVAHVYTSRCQEALDNQHAKRSLGWIIRKRLVQAETALQQLSTEDDARNVQVLHEHIAQRITCIENALAVLSNGGVYEHVIRINFEDVDKFQETVAYTRDRNEGIVLEAIELVPKLVDLECTIEELVDAVLKRIAAEDDKNRQALSERIAWHRREAEATLVRCGETSNKIHCDTSQELAVIERGSMELAGRVRLTEYATAGILGLLCVVVAGITLRQVAGILEERKGLLGDLRKHHDHLDELVTVRTSALIEANQQLQQEVTEREQAEEALRESEGRLKALLNANPTGIVVIDTETHEIVDANPVAVNMIGASREQVLGRKCHKYICPAESGQCPITDLGQKVDNSERVLIRADGEEVPILKTVVPIVLDGRDCLLESFIDITERKRAEEALKESQQYTRALIEAHLDPLVTISSEGKIMDVNHATESVTGHPREKLVGTDFSGYFTDPDKARRGYQRVFKEKQVRDYPLDIKHRGGSVTPVLYNASVYHDMNGDVAGVFAAARDITELKRAEQELKEYATQMESSNAALQEANAEAETARARAERAKDELKAAQQQLVDASRQAGMAEVATGVLHNVGNVLNSVNVSASVAADKLRKSRVPGLAKAVELMGEHADDLGTFITEDEKGKQLPGYLTKLSEHLADEQAAVLEELGSLTQNIDHIKNIVSMQQSYAGASGVIESVSIPDLMEDALKINTAGFDRHGVRVVREYGEVPQITADKHKLLQILANLLSNGKYALSERGGEDRRLTLRIRTCGDDRVCIEVADNGVGIPAENLTRIFAHGFTTREGGHGFGLHHSALAAKEMGGLLSARSDGPDKGATFTLELPLEPAEVTG